MIRARYKVAVVGVLLVPSVIALVRRGLAYESVAPGSSAEFWEYACAVQLKAFHGHLKYSYWGGIYPPIEARLFYYTQDHHRQFLYSVSPAEVASDLPEVRAALQLDVKKCPNSDPELCEFYKDGAPTRLMCRNYLARSAASAPIVGVVSDIQKARLRLHRFGQIDTREEEAFRARLARADRVWLSLVFEGVFIIGWVLFTAWPWLRGARFGRFVLHFGLSPVLLFIPYFLGYAPMTFTFGPSGGFVYPSYLVLASVPVGRIPCSRVDEVLWNMLPPLLAPLAQVPGAPAAATTYRCVGPFASLLFGAMIAVVLLAGRQLTRGFSGWRSRATAEPPAR